MDVVPSSAHCKFSITSIVLASETNGENIVKKNAKFKMILSENHFLFEVFGKFIFSIVNKKNIYLYFISGKETTRDALPYFYGTVLTALLHLHYKFPMHCSASLGKKGLNLFCAKSGTGKSTLAINLHIRGYPIFTDDKCIMQWNPILKKYLAEPSIRAIRLHDDAIENIEHPELLKNPVPISAKEGKYQFNIDDTMLKNLNLIQQIFIIRKSEKVDTIKIVELKNQRKAKVLFNQLHRPGLLIGEKMKLRARKFIRNLAVQVPVFIVVKPESIPIQEFVDYIESRIQ